MILLSEVNWMIIFSKYRFIHKKYRLLISSLKNGILNLAYKFCHNTLFFAIHLWYILTVESFKAVAISIKVGDAYEYLFKIYRKEVVLCQSMKR